MAYLHVVKTSLNFKQFLNIPCTIVCFLCCFLETFTFYYFKGYLIFFLLNFLVRYSKGTISFEFFVLLLILSNRKLSELCYQLFKCDCAVCQVYLLMIIFSKSNGIYISLLKIHIEYISYAFPLCWSYIIWAATSNAILNYSDDRKCFLVNRMASIDFSINYFICCRFGYISTQESSLLLLILKGRIQLSLTGTQTREGKQSH